jgi:hypothetical protein
MIPIYHYTIDKKDLCLYLRLSACLYLGFVTGLSDIAKKFFVG